MRARAVYMLVSLLCLPHIVFAQVDSALVGKIKADLRARADAAQFSDVELDAMARALADEAQDQNVAGEYLASGNSFQTNWTFSPPEEGPTRPSTALILALAALFMALVCLVWYLARPRKIVGEELPEEN
jgi:Flp pilus assembly protein TadB